MNLAPIRPITLLISAAIILQGFLGCAPPVQNESYQSPMLARMSPLPAPPPISLAPEMESLLLVHRELGAKPIEALTPILARRQPSLNDAVRVALLRRTEKSEPVSVGRIRDISIPSPEGMIPARVYEPFGARGPLPLVIYFHGGGWVIGSLDAYDASARALANDARALVVSAHYRQAPEHPFPAAVHDAFQATRWLMENAGLLGAEPSQVALAGEGSGGNLAAVVTQLLERRSLPQPLHQLLIYPPTEVNYDTPSYYAYPNTAPLGGETMWWFYSYYLSDPTDAETFLVSPLRGNLRGTPSATVITADIDPLRSEGAAYAKKLAESGVEVAYRNFTGVTHDFFGTGQVVPTAREAQRFAGERLRAAFKTGKLQTK